MVQRLAKGVLPANTSLHKDAILALSKGATVFINYLAHAANTASLASGKRTIPPAAVIDALADLEFDAFGPRVEAELRKFNEVQTGKRNEYRRKVKEGKMHDGAGAGGGDGEGEDEGEEGGGRAKKRVRREEVLVPEPEQEGVEEADEEAGRDRRVGEPDPSAQLQTGYREFVPPRPRQRGDDDDEDEEEEQEEETEDFDPRGRRRGDDGSRRQQGEEEDDEDEEDEGDEDEEEEEEEDDEDEYPDEGRRLSSVEREANGGFDEGSERDVDDEDDDGDDDPGSEDEGSE